MNIETTKTRAYLDYSFENFQENDAITIEEGEFVYENEPFYYAQYEINGISLTAQFDCDDNWSWYNLGGDGDSSEETAKHYFNREDQKFIDFLDGILVESKPDRDITTTQKADYLREYYKNNKNLFDLADKVKKIVTEKSDDFALVLAFYCRNGLEDSGSFECNMQISAGLSKEQTLALTELFYERG